MTLVIPVLIVNISLEALDGATKGKIILIKRLYQIKIRNKKW